MVVEPDPVASGQPGGRPRGQRRRLPDRRVAEAHRGRGRAGQHHDRSGRGAADRPGHAVPVARGRDRGLHRLRRRLLARVQLRLPEHDVVEHAVDAAADGHQPARGVRAHVRPGRAARRSARRAIRDERSMLDSITAEARQLQRGLGRARSPARVASISTTCARSSAASSAPRRATAPTSRSRRRSACPTRSRSTSTLMYDLLAVAYQADVTRVFTFMLSRELSQRTYPQHRRHRAAPHRVAPRQRRAEDRAERARSTPIT